MSTLGPPGLYVRSTPIHAIDPSGLLNPESPHDLWAIPDQRDRTNAAIRKVWIGKSPLEIMEEVDEQGSQQGKSDKWKHFMVSYRITRETALGPIICLPAGWVKEIWDQCDPNPPGGRWDWFGDMAANYGGHFCGMLSMLTGYPEF